MTNNSIHRAYLFQFGGYHTYFYEEIIPYDVPVIKEDWKVRKYKLHLPDEKLLALELEKAQHEIMGQGHLTMPVGRDKHRRGL